MKKKVKKRLKDAYCVRLTVPIDYARYAVWPGKCYPRGRVFSPIGYGRTAAEAWIEAYKTVRDN